MGPSLSIDEIVAARDYKQYPIKSHPDCDKAYAELSAQEIMQRVEHDHAQIIALYKYLRGHVETPSAQDFMDQLISLEEHQGMLMSQSANRLDDL